MYDDVKIDYSLTDENLISGVWTEEYQELLDRLAVDVVE